MKSIYVSSPINRTAGLVVSSGTEYQPSKKVAPGFSELPIPTRPIPTGTRSLDLTGHRCGRLVVTGLAAEKAKRWVARCDCGYYVIRTAKALRNHDNSEDCCDHCRHLIHLKRNESWRRLGKGAEPPAPKKVCKPRPIEKRLLRADRFFAWQRVTKSDGRIKYTLKNGENFWTADVPWRSGRKEIAAILRSNRKKFRKWMETTSLGGCN